MDRQSLLDLIATLPPEQQAAVEAFVKFLQKSQPRNGDNVSFEEALDAFTRQHGELLRRLAQ